MTEILSIRRQIRKAIHEYLIMVGAATKSQVVSAMTTRGFDQTTVHTVFIRMEQTQEILSTPAFKSMGSLAHLSDSVNGNRYSSSRESDDPTA